MVSRHAIIGVLTLEVVYKPSLESKSGVGVSYPILKIRYVFLWLATSLRLDF